MECRVHSTQTVSLKIAQMAPVLRNSSKELTASTLNNAWTPFSVSKPQEATESKHVNRDSKLTHSVTYKIKAVSKRQFAQLLLK